LKNIFLVINKEKVYAYFVSIFTIVILFFMSNMISSDFDSYEETSTNIVSNNTNFNNITINTNSYVNGSKK